MANCPLMLSITNLIFSYTHVAHLITERETGNGKRETGNGKRETGNGKRDYLRLLKFALILSDVILIHCVVV